MLGIVKRLARVMGGDVSLTSTPGVGSSFTLYLPLEYVGPAVPAGRKTLNVVN